MRLQASDIIAQPRWLCFGFDPGLRDVHFVHVDDALLESSTFVDPGWALSQPHVRLPLEDVADAIADLPEPLSNGLILHTAFACSTLLARCLQITGRLQVLRELPLFSGLALAREALAATDQLRQWRQLLVVASSMPARPFDAGAATLNKPGNVLLSVATELLTQNPVSKAVVIHTDLPAFLGSCSKKLASGAEPWRAMLRGLQPALHILENAGIDRNDTDPFHWASTIWHLQMQLLHELAASPAASRVRQLSANTFLRAPASVIDDVKAWLAPEVDAPIDQHRLDEVLSRHAKQPGLAFGRERREHERQIVNQHFSTDIGTALRWSEHRFGRWEEAYELGLDRVSIQ